MGWVLAGYELERQPNRTGRQASVESRRGAVALAQKIADEENVTWISPGELSRMASSTAGMHYIVDVRSEDEYAAEHIPGSLNVPGGQAVQRADDFIAVRNAPIVFVSNESARAVMAAYWYRQMGFPEVSVLHGGLRAWSESGGRMEAGAHDSKPLGFDEAVASVRWIDPPAARQKIADAAVIILDLSTSIEFDAAHIPGARWISRGWIELKLPEECPDQNQAIILMCQDGRQSILAAATLKEMGYGEVTVLRGGVRAWAAAGFPTAQGMDSCLVEPNDVVLSPSIRGNKEDMQRYLDWELTLRK
jgi:rhodanese-related sulfurtransferase